MKKLFWPFVLLLAGVAAIRRLVAGRASAAEEPAPDSASYDAIDAYVEHEMRRLKIPGVSLAVVEGDRIVHLRGLGRALPDGEAPTPQTPFVLGSTTKSFTALAVMQLVEAGKIELDAPVQRYLPWFRVADPQASAQMTVRHLLHQTSGLPGGPVSESWPISTTARAPPSARRARYPRSCSPARSAWRSNTATRITACSG